MHVLYEEGCRYGTGAGEFLSEYYSAEDSLNAIRDLLRKRRDMHPEECYGSENMRKIDTAIWQREKRIWL